MTSGERHVVITGAGGFIGARLHRRMRADPAFATATFTLVDTVPPDVGQGTDIRTVTGDLADPKTLDTIFEHRPDMIVHLAGVLGGAAERDPALARRVNLDATLDLLERARDERRPPRFVFASSIAVFGPPLPSIVDDDSHPVPTMVYGAQKRMAEVAVEHMSARGWIDGLAVRLPGIVARRGADARLKSAFLNTMFYDYEAGREVVLPVSPLATTWLVSVTACVESLLHACVLPADRLAGRRAFTLPAQRVAVSEIVDALARRFTDSGAKVSYAPDPALDAQFGTFPPLETKRADELGFRHDGDVDRLVARAMED